MLKAFALDLHRCEHQAVAHKVRGITDALRCLEAEREKRREGENEIEIAIREVQERDSYHKLLLTNRDKASRAQYSPS